MIFVVRIQKCRAAISYWKKDQEPYDQNKINNLKAELEEAKEDDQATQEEINRITRELKEAYNNEENF